MKAPQRPVARAEARSRLQLDAGQVSSSQAAFVAAQEQVAAARAAASAAEASASAAGERLRAVEAEMARVREEAKAQTDALLQLRQQLSLDRAQREQPSSWVMALIGVAALLAAMVVWLARRVHKQSRVPAPRSEADWWDRDAAPSKSAAMAEPAVSDLQQPTQMPATLRMASEPAAWSDSAHSGNSVFEQLISPPTMPAPREVTSPSVPPVPTREEEANRAMSVDEQIDLEQQADFFIALGHDDAAIDLLMAHMRSTGGGSPLPFLKLLEIHRRRDQREAYERTRIRFNQRFNSVAPEWQADPKAGRTLDDYPMALGRIQRAWPSPLDAMAEIEALLFRRGSEAELFDLPAYQEVLFLFQVARDLHQAEDAGAEDVDVLLPIGGRSAPMAVAAGTIVLRPEFNDGEPVSLDLDLTTDHGEIAAEASAEPEPKFTLEQVDDPRPAEPDDLWGSPPDVRPTR
jgi:pilus assembly protein FimV